MKRKRYKYRIKKKAEGVYVVEEHHTFMFLWEFWTVGSTRFKIEKQYASPELADAAVKKAAEEKGVKVIVINTEGVRAAVSGAVKKARKARRKKTRQAEERKQNLKRIGKEPEEQPAPAKPKAARKTTRKPKAAK